MRVAENVDTPGQDMESAYSITRRTTLILCSHFIVTA